MEPGESPIEAALREAREEAGIQIKLENLEFSHVMHRRKANHEEKLDLWFSCEKWDGTPYNAEPEKCDDLRWFSWDSLPPNLVRYVRTAVFLIRDGCRFSVYDDNLVYSSGIDSRVHEHRFKGSSR